MKQIFVQSNAYSSRNYDLFYNETNSEIWSEDSMFFNLIHILQSCGNDSWRLRKSTIKSDKKSRKTAENKERLEICERKKI